ncbi:hypothetical protein HW561_11240 [Rhodobacteraceae bacterium B1Z28]|uniref:Tetratricopeptide repeat protein n=1 Tax=Ruegeria haliotis TaxID=2747601 RepID=A0ABX2PQF8_9RHOB|nr:tetratricopeptide repeat protein [Ruegeria haliotis]NVO56364.1 hypothetical protein [Ruegeria haliotis]
MHIRLAALIIVAATLLLSLNSPSRTEINYPKLVETCQGGSAQLSEIISACTQLIETEDVPSEYRLAFLTDRGWAFFCNSQYDLALADENHILEVLPEDLAALRARAHIYEAMGDRTAAEADLVKALQIAPDNPRILFHKAEFDDDHGEHDSAYAGVRRVLEIDPDFPGAAEKEVTYLMTSGEFDAAEERLEAAELKWPDEDWVYYRDLQLHVLFTKDIEKALNATSNMARVAPGVYSELYYPALVHMRLGDEKTAIDYISGYGPRLIEEKNPESGWWGQFTRMIATWYVVGNRERHIHQGMAYAYMQRPDLAMVEYETFLNETGRNGKKLLAYMVRQDLQSIDQRKFRFSEAYRRDVLVEYIEVLASKSGFPIIEVQ